MQRVDRSIFVLFLLGFFTVTSAQLPPEIRADAYLLQAEQAIRNGDSFRAQAAIQNILRLQKEHELDLSDEFHFRYAKAADAVDLSEQALESIVKYLTASGREGQHYVEALALMNKVKDKSSGDVVAAQLSPNIIADAYLLKAEQAIRDGDHNRARDAIQNIRNLQEQHELDLPDEFHFRYAKAADVLDMSDQALESVLKYLVASGREGQHYLDALELMNKVQTAVSCKGWDTEEYFKTATLEEVTACLDAGVDLNERDDAGATPLHRAAQNIENQDVIKALIEAGADKEAGDNDKRTPLHWAVVYNNSVAIKALIEASADLDVQDKDKQTPLSYSVFFGHRTAIEVLIEAGADRGLAAHTWTFLHWAVTYNKNPVAIKALLNAGANPKAKDHVKQTPLHVAAKFNENPDILKVLIEAGADLNARDGYRSTPLHIAAEFNKNLNILKVLIEAGADLKARDGYRSTPLHVVAKFNENPEVVKLLLDAGAGLKTRDLDQSTPLHVVAKFNKNPEVVKLLLDAGADPMAQGENKFTPLHYAASNNENPDVIKVLFNVGADPNASAKSKFTSLHVAAQYNKNPDVVKVLIEAGADLKKRAERNITPLHVAAAHSKNSDILKVLIEAGADLNARLNARGKYRTPLHLAAQSNPNPDVVKILLNAGAKIEPTRGFLSDKQTPLHLAARSNSNPAIVKILIDAGADIEARSDKETPLHKAAQNNPNPDVIKVLIEAGANLEARRDFKRTPLHLAAWFNENPAIVQVLIDAGADLNARDHDDKTPLYFAAEYEDRPDVAKILRDAGATQTKISGKSQGDSFSKAAALIGGAAIMYAGKDAADQEAVAEAARQFMEGVLTEQPVGSGNINSATPSSQFQGGQTQGTMQQALQNLENVCGEKYQGNFSDNDHYRFYCLAAFNDYCALKRAKSDEAISKLRASLQQNCAVLKSVGADSKCSYCK